MLGLYVIIIQDMRLIKSDDFYSLKVRGYVTMLHLQVLNVLYQPILGFVATTVYHYFYAMREFRKGEPVSFTNVHTHLEFSYDQLSSAISRLEALGLARSFLAEHKEFNEYIIELYAPKDPVQFSEDQIFMHLLNDKVGPRQTQDLVALFTLDAPTRNKEDVSSDFSEVYATDFSLDNGYQNVEKTKLQNVVGGVKLEFDRALFLNILVGERLFSMNAFSEEELHTIEQISGIYALTERAAVDKIGEYYEATKPHGSRIDFKAMRKALNEIMKYGAVRKTLRREHVTKLSGERQKIKLINDMEILGNSEFLSMLNNGVKNAPADERLLQTLSSDYFLRPPVINALVYFTLLNFNDELPRSLVEKLASSLVRKGVTTALDTLDALERPYKREQTASAPSAKPKTKKKDVPETEHDPLDDEIMEILKKYR